MANDGSSYSGRGGGVSYTVRRRCGTLTRVDLLIFLLAAALCSASYRLAIWHNSRGAVDRSLLGPTAGAATYDCGGDGANADETLDFVAHHAAEDAGLAVSTKTTTTGTRRALRGVADDDGGGGGKRWPAAAAARVDGGGSRLRFADAVAVQA